jgi:hypothetical protein
MVAWLPVLLLLTGLLAVVLLELTAHLVAGARAATLADAAALAAVAADAEGEPTPCLAAQQLVVAGEGRLEACAGPASAGNAEVAVSVAVPSLLEAPLGPDRRVADAAAVLVPTTGSDEPSTGSQPATDPAAGSISGDP